MLGNTLRQFVYQCGYQSTRGQPDILFIVEQCKRLERSNKFLCNRPIRNHIQRSYGSFHDHYRPWRGAEVSVDVLLTLNLEDLDALSDDKPCGLRKTERNSESSKALTLE